MAKGAFQTPVNIFGATRSGTGKSSLVSNLGIFLHGRGGRVAFVDLNSNQPLQLKANFPKSVTVDEYPDLSEIAGSNSGRFRRTFFISNADRLSIFTGYKIQDTAQLLNDTSLRDFFLQIRSNFDHVLINLPYGIEGFNLFEAFSLNRATREIRPPICVIVTTPEIRASSEIDYLLRKKPALRHVLSENLLVVFNKVSHKVEDQNIENLQLKLSDVKTVLQLPITLGIPYLDDFKAQRSNPNPLVLSPTSSVRQVIAGLARTLADLSDGEIPWEKSSLSDSFKPFSDPVAFARISPLLLQIKTAVARRLFISPDRIHAYAEKDGDSLKVRIRLTSKSVKAFSPILSVDYKLVKPEFQDSEGSFSQIFSELKIFTAQFREKIRPPDISVKPVYHIDDRFASSAKFEISENLKFVYQLPEYPLPGSFIHNHIITEIPSLTQLLGFGKKKRPRISFAGLHFSFLEFYFTHFAIPPQFDFQMQFKCGFEPGFTGVFLLAFPVRWLKLRLPMKRPVFLGRKSSEEKVEITSFVAFKWNICKVQNKVVVTLPWKSSNPGTSIEHYFSPRKFLGISFSKPAFWMLKEEGVSVVSKAAPKFYLPSPGILLLPPKESAARGVNSFITKPRLAYGEKINIPDLYQLKFREISDLSTMKTIVQITDFHFPKSVISFHMVPFFDELEIVSSAKPDFPFPFDFGILRPGFSVRIVENEQPAFEFRPITLPYRFRLDVRASIESRGEMLIQQEPSALPPFIRLEKFELSWVHKRYGLPPEAGRDRIGIKILLDGFFKEISQGKDRTEKLKLTLIPRNWEKYDARKSILAFLAMKSSKPEYAETERGKEKGFSFFPSETRCFSPPSQTISLAVRKFYDPEASLVLQATSSSFSQFEYCFPARGDSQGPSTSMMGYCPTEAWIHSTISPLSFLVGQNLLGISERQSSIVISHGALSELSLETRFHSFSLDSGIEPDVPPYHQRIPDLPVVIADWKGFPAIPPGKSSLKIKVRASPFFRVHFNPANQELTPVSGIKISRANIPTRKFWIPPILSARPDLKIKELETIEMLYKNLIERGRIHFGFPNQFNATHLLMKWAKKLRILARFSLKYKFVFPVNYFVLNPFVGLSGEKFQRGTFSVRQSNIQDLLAAARSIRQSSQKFPGEGLPKINKAT